MDLGKSVLSVIENTVAKQVQEKFDPAVDKMLAKLEEKLGAKYGLAVVVVSEIIQESRADAKAALLELVDKIDGQVG